MPGPIMESGPAQCFSDSNGTLWPWWKRSIETESMDLILHNSTVTTSFTADSRALQSLFPLNNVLLTLEFRVTGPIDEVSVMWIWTTGERINVEETRVLRPVADETPIR
ncbi:hypothetical protein PRK78_001324 [Emydomyces testavorans]|uniref:Uncharacterized protein n=1 Tax=Emydomyces testavorans TaxID=2070801 RepID=A0AAF0IIJ6_9EURO|nr:hypothetical protein PRK78_001324 [Emydomyces testavorans]